MGAKIGHTQRQRIGDPIGLQLGDLASGQVKVAAIWAGESFAIPKLGLRSSSPRVSAKGTFKYVAGVWPSLLLVI